MKWFFFNFYAAHKTKKKNVLKNKMKKLLISLVQGPGVLKKKDPIIESYSADTV